MHLCCSFKGIVNLLAYIKLQITSPGAPPTVFAFHFYSHSSVIGRYRENIHSLNGPRCRKAIRATGSMGKSCSFLSPDFIEASSRPCSVGLLWSRWRAQVNLLQPSSGCARRGTAWRQTLWPSVFPFPNLHHRRVHFTTKPASCSPGRAGVHVFSFFLVLEHEQVVVNH